MIYRMAIKVVGVKKREGVREGEREFRERFSGQLEICTVIDYILVNQKNKTKQKHEFIIILRDNQGKVLLYRRIPANDSRRNREVENHLFPTLSKIIVSGK